MSIEPPPAPRAVFLSYASQDAEAVLRIAEALRASGVVVWFDKDELVGGDAWDAKIRGQIASCALFVPVISGNTQARLEGYFRIEWKLAAQRTHAMADEKAFLMPVVIDETRDAEAKVPAEFKAVQWTRLPGGGAAEKFCARVKTLLEGGARGGSREAFGLESGAGETPTRSAATKTKRARWLWPVAFAAGVFGAIAVWRPWARPAVSATAPVAVARPAAPLSPARELAERANVLSLKKYNSTADDFAAAEGLLKQALALDQNDAEIWAISSQFNTAIRTRGFDDAPARREAARSQAERALKLNPQSIEGMFALGRWQRDNDSDRTVAEKTFQAVLARDPDHEGAIGNLGTMYGRQDRVEEALAMFERAARNPASLPLARYSQYLLYFNHWRFEEAERAIRESIAAEPSSNSVTGLAMVLLTAKGDAAAAVRALAEMPAANRNEHRAVWISAFAHLAARDPEAALTAMRRLSADFVHDNWFTGPTAYWVGRAHAQAGRPEAARIAFESGLTVMDAKLKTSPEDFALHIARGELLGWLGRTDEARREARTATELAQGFQGTLWFLSPARIYAALGLADEAVPLLEKLSARDQRSVQWPLTAALLRVDPLWDKLRGDPRFQALCAEPAAEKKTVVAPAAPLSPARELVAKAQALLDAFDATREDLALAEDYCQRALKLDPTDGEVWAIAAQANSTYVYRGWDTTPERREQTRMMAERAIRLSPASPQAKLAQASAWSTFGVNRAETEKLLREVVAERPNDQGALRFLAVTVLGRGGLDECLALNERSAGLPGGDPLALFNNARYLWQNGRSAEAYAMLLRSLAQKKSFGSALVLKASMEITWRNDLAAAEATLQQIPQSMLLEDRANYTAGLVRFYQRRAGAAIEAWSSFPRDYYRDFAFDGPKGLLVGLADELDHRDAAAKIEWRTALQAVEKRIAATPNKASPYYYKAYLLACLGDKAGATEALRTHEELDGVKYTAESPMTFELALVYARLGRFDEFFAFPPKGRFRRLELDPRFEALRADPRYKKLLEERQRQDAEAKK